MALAASAPAFLLQVMVCVCWLMHAEILEVIFINERLERLSSFCNTVLVLFFLVVVQLLVQRFLHIA